MALPWVFSLKSPLGITKAWSSGPGFFISQDYLENAHSHNHTFQRCYYLSVYRVSDSSPQSEFNPVSYPFYRINDLAEIYGLPKSPKITPKVGGGHIFTKLEYNLFLVTANLVMLLFISYLFLKLDIGYRIFGSRRITEAP